MIGLMNCQPDNQITYINILRLDKYAIGYMGATMYTTSNKEKKYLIRVAVKINV